LDGRRIERVYLTEGSKVRAGLSTLSFTPMDEEVVVEPDELGQLGGMVGRSDQMRQIFGMIKKIAPMNVPVIIQGETGTGKELVARAIHDCSRRLGGPFVVLDCGAILPSLIESELFGHEKGAFTGAFTSRPGAFERAHGGTIFLDELGELRFDLQPKLLRVLENRELRRLGGNSLISVDVRVVVATHRDLAKEIQEGHFREDLYFRLSVTHIHLPPLRERKEDIPAILERALSDPEILAKHGHKRFTPAAMELLMAYRWPGNVRELINVLANVLTFSQTEEIDARHLPVRIQAEVRDEPLSFNEHLPFKVAREQLLERFEREYLAQVLKRCRGNIGRASRETGLHRRSIERLAKKHRLATRSQKPK
jgi:DNA-binding NtrC family response regulator